jgi:2-polyprenyl-3-methyl-5-hydroxy-6-metoxy-1,4-benzoquinol methylase
MGCADGLMTRKLVDQFETVVAVDGSQKYCERTREEISSDALTVTHSMFGDFNADEPFDTIVACHVLEHLEEPQSFLAHLSDLLAADGRLLLDVPNAGSLHRRVGVKMGLLNQIDELNERDEMIGHKRVYRRDEFHAELRRSGFTISATGGVFLKPLTNNQMEEWFTDDMSDAFAALGEEVSDYAAEIYAVCEP